MANALFPAKKFLQIHLSSLKEKMDSTGYKGSFADLNQFFHEVEFFFDNNDAITQNFQRFDDRPALIGMERLDYTVGDSGETYGDMSDPHFLVPKYKYPKKHEPSDVELKQLAENLRQAMENLLGLLEAQVLSQPNANWMRVEATNSEIVAELHDILIVIVKNFSTSNSISLDEGDAIGKDAIVSMLKTCIKILESPLHEKTLLKNTKDQLSGITKRLVHKQIERGFSQLIERAIELLGKILL